MRGLGCKEAIGCLFGIVVIVWLLVQCTGGDKDKTDSLHTTTKMTTFLAQDIATYNKGQKAMNTGDTSVKMRESPRFLVSLGFLSVPLLLVFQYHHFV